MRWIARIQQMMVVMSSHPEGEALAQLGAAAGVGEPPSDPAQMMPWFFEVFFGVADDFHGETVRECEYWRSQLRLSDLERLVLDGEFGDSDTQRAMREWVASQVETFNVLFEAGEETPLRSFAAIVESPIAHDPLFVNFREHDRLSAEQARALLDTPNNLALLILFAAESLSEEGDQRTLARRQANADVLLSVGRELELGLDEAGVVYLLHLARTDRPWLEMSQRFERELGGDPEWVCLIMASRGRQTLCRLEGPHATDVWQQD
jgi:hypothetical protein